MHVQKKLREKKYYEKGSGFGQLKPFCGILFPISASA